MNEKEPRISPCDVGPMPAGPVETNPGTAAEVASVAVPVPLARVFHYSIPAGMESVARGHRVWVQFSGRRAAGFVLSVGPRPPEGFSGNLKPLMSLMDTEPLPEDLVSLAEWIAARYLCPIGMVLQTIVPAAARRAPKPKLQETVIWLADGPETDRLLSDLPEGHKKRRSIACELSNAGPMELKTIQESLGATRADLKWFVDRNLIRIDAVRINRYHSRRKTVTGSLGPDPTPAQAEAIGSITGAMSEGRCEVFMLHGVTGSGKTEVYLRCLEHAVARGLCGLVLVPEISLTPQMVRIFTSRFPDMVAVLHSAMSDGARFDEWDRILNGGAPVVVGARSAVFAPLPSLGVVIVDEEHEGSYKQASTAPLYHAREVALRRALKSGCPAVLGSATPSLESYYKARSGEYTLLELPDRIAGRPLPEVTVVDMREEFKVRNFSLFSTLLGKFLKETVDSGTKAILLMNRRGHSSFVFCRECGEPLTCPHCSVSLKFHSPSADLRCHTCDYSGTLPKECPACSSPYIKYFGAGTQKVLQELQRTFPGVRALRMDTDTTGRRDAHEEILDRFSGDECQVLVGTQMVAKGLDIHKVTLVGIVSADIALNLPDFRAGERTFQLLTQVSGRAGRGEDAGRVVVQTYMPSALAVKTAARHDFIGFYEEEIKSRLTHGLPPFSEAVRIVFSSDTEEGARATAQEFYHSLRISLEKVSFESGRPRERGGDTQAREADMKILSPSPAPVEKIRDRFRWHILCFSTRPEELLAAVACTSSEFAGRKTCTSIVIDVDPVSFL